jgi:hypothetical protein
VSAWTSSELESFGYEEPERGRVEDNAQNRKLLRRFGANWAFEVDVDEEMRPTGLLRVFTPEQVTARRTDVYERRENLLVDPENPWSDYLSPIDFPLESDAPTWVLAKAQEWKAQERQGLYESERTPLPVRCEVFRTDETRCWNWAGFPDKVRRCRSHAGWKYADATLANYARSQLLGMTPDVVDELERLAYQGDTDTVKLKAMTEILDRAGIRGGTEIDVHHDVEVTVSAEQITGKLDQLKQRTEKRAELEARARDTVVAETHETVEGEVVSRDAGPVDGGT